MKQMLLIGIAALSLSCGFIYGEFNNPFDPGSTTYDASSRQIDFGSLDSAAGAGDSIDFWNNYMAIGIPGDRFGADATGSVVIYERVGVNSWEFRQKLRSSSPVNNELFGKSLAFVQGQLFVGASGASSNNGRLYRFAQDSNGTWQQQLLNYTGSSGGQLGYAMDAYGSLLVVGEPASDNGILHALEIGSDGSIENSSTASSGAGSSRFGASISVYGNRILTGGESVNNFVLWTYSGGTWVQQAVMAMTTSGRVSAVAMDANYAVVGSMFHDGGATDNSGMFEVFSIAEDHTLTNMTGTDFAFAHEANAFVGSSLALSNGVLYVGARGESGGRGLVRQYSATGGGVNLWVLSGTTSPLSSTGSFGDTLVVKNNLIMVGSNSNASGGGVDVFVVE